MLLANETVARTLKGVRLPALYRVHDKPDPDKLNDLRDFLATFDVATGDLTNRKEIVRLLKLLKTHPQGHLLRIQILRSLKRAVYRASPDGHYGLNKVDYTHFTSPIRRYSDLVVHRVFGSLPDQALQPAERAGKFRRRPARWPRPAAWRNTSA